jgi:hypothetical protein
MGEARRVLLEVIDKGDIRDRGNEAPAAGGMAMGGGGGGGGGDFAAAGGHQMQMMGGGGDVEETDLPEELLGDPMGEVSIEVPCPGQEGRVIGGAVQVESSLPIIA